MLLAGAMPRAGAPLKSQKAQRHRCASLISSTKSPDFRHLRSSTRTQRVPCRQRHLSANISMPFDSTTAAAFSASDYDHHDNLLANAAPQDLIANPQHPRLSGASPYPSAPGTPAACRPSGASQHESTVPTRKSILSNIVVFDLRLQLERDVLRLLPAGLFMASELSLSSFSISRRGKIGSPFFTCSPLKHLELRTHLPIQHQHTIYRAAFLFP